MCKLGNEGFGGKLRNTAWNSTMWLWQALELYMGIQPQGNSLAYLPPNWSSPLPSVFGLKLSVGTLVDFLLASWSQFSSVKYGAKLFTLWPAWTSLAWLPSFWQSLVMPMLWLKLSYCGFSNKATMSWLFHFWIAWAFSRKAVTVGPCWGFIGQ